MKQSIQKQKRGGGAWTLAVGVVAFFCAGLTVATAAELLVGMSTPLVTGPTALGLGAKLGVEALFQQVNKEGGINGNTLKLVALDDGYEPDKTAPNMRRLIGDGVLAVLANVGTPTAVVAVPIANELKTPLIGAITGASVLRKSPPDRYIINYRADYNEETATMVNGLLSNGIKPEEIAFFTQDDAYGDAGYNGSIKALEAKGFAAAKSLPHGRYARNTVNVEAALSKIIGAAVEPKAIIMVGAYKACAAFIKLAKAELPKTLFLNVSFVGSLALAQELGPSGEGVIVTQVVPDLGSDLPGVQAYRAALKSFNAEAEPDFLSLEGYLAAKIFVEGLKKAGATPTRESLVDGLEGLQGLDLGIGTKISFSKSEHQASHTVWPTRIKGGKFVLLDWSKLQ